jgi:UPF0716 protein FxsA
MFPFLLAAFILGPLIELFVIIQVGQRIGVLETILVLLLTGVVGAWLVRREGVAAWRRLNEALLQGKMPAVEIADGAMILLAGALMVTPGFITDVIGFALLIPPVRAAIRRSAVPVMIRRAERQARRAAADRWAGRGPGPGGDPGGGPSDRIWVIDADAHNSDTEVSWGTPEERDPEQVRRRDDDRGS